MSTKVYNGYRLPPTIRVENLLDWSDGLRAHLAPLRKITLDAVLFRYARHKFDQHCLKAAGLSSHVFDEGEDTPWKGALASAREDLAELAQGRRRPSMDVEVSAMLHFRPDRPTIYLRLFSESRDLSNATVDQGGLLDFAYWDNVDEPDNIPIDTFRRRGKIWSKLAGYESERHPNAINTLVTFSAPPCEADLESTRLFDPDFVVPEAWHDKFEERSYDRALGALRADQFPQEVNDSLSRGSFSAYMAYERTLRKGENEEFNQHLARVREVLVRRVEPASFQWDAATICAAISPRRKSPSP